MSEHIKLNFKSKDDNLDREPFKATKIWNELVEHLRASVEQRRRRWKFQYYENCFRGGDVVKVLHAYVQSNPHLSKDATRSQVRCLCQILLEKRVIECVTLDSNRTKKDSFEDGNKLYRFSPANGSFDHAVASPSQVERKISRRRSLLGQREKSSSRRKSLQSNRMFFSAQLCKLPPQCWYFDWQFALSNLQPARTTCSRRLQICSCRFLGRFLLKL